MSLTKELGNLLITLDNALTTVFGDNACVTHLIPSPKYKDDDTILDITVTILKSKYDEEEYKQRMEIFDNIVYNPLWNSDYILAKVPITINEW